MVKRTAALLLSLLFLLTSVGMWLLFPLLQGYYRLKANQVIEYQPSELVTLRLASTEFERVGDDEIVYHHLRYDIEKEQLTNGVYEFRAYPDYLETQLLSFFDETWRGITDASETHSPVGQFVKKILTTDYFCEWVYFAFDADFANTKTASFVYTLPIFWAYSSALYTPPEG
jgi:hypothetical protein